MTREAFLIAVILGLALTGPAAAQSAPAPPVRAAASEKVCQLTGEIDWQTGRPTEARTYSRFGLEAADLGYPIEHDGKLVLMFGDSWPTLQQPGTLVEAPPNDAVGIVTRTAAPDAASCLGMRINDVSGATMQLGGQTLKVYAPATVTAPQTIQQGFFEVPTGGVSVSGALYAFFWTDHCARSHAIHANSDTPLARPAARDDRCPESDDRNSIGRGLLARSDDDGKTFTHAVPMPPGFVYSIAVNPAAEKAPGDSDILIFGVPRYRVSVPYLAKAAPDAFADPARWRFFTGRDANGAPRWVDYKSWAGSYAPSGPAATNWHPPAGAPEIFSSENGPKETQEACIGEFSVTWNAPLAKWLMLYNCSNGIEARLADAPWGPWSQPTLMLSRADDVACKIVMSARGCGNRRDFWPSRRTGPDVVTGGFYAPFVLNRYTKAGPDHSAIVYWLVSTWNPYEVDVMRTALKAR